MWFFVFPTIRESLRRTYRQPFFTLTIIGLFGLAIGTNTLLFSILDAVVLRATPFPNATQVIGVSCNTEALKDGHPFSVPVATALRDQSSLMEDLGYYRQGS